MHLKMYSCLLITILAVCYANGEQIDFCSFGLSSNLDGHAYTIINSEDEVKEFQDIFENYIRGDKISNKFESTFGESVNTVKSFNWYYNFGSLGRINISKILPKSLQCIYVYDREIPSKLYEGQVVTAEAAVKYLVNEVIYQAAKETQTHVRLPLLEVSNYNAVGCNFAKSNSKDEEYFLIHCANDDGTGNVWNTTKIIEKSTAKEFCVSDVKGICENTTENIVAETFTVNVADIAELKEVLRSMNCINCTININVQPQ